MFCDGFAYHVQSADVTSRLADDIRKRRSIVESGHWLHWSVTWADVKAFGGEKDSRIASMDVPFFEDAKARRKQPDGIGRRVGSAVVLLPLLAVRQCNCRTSGSLLLADVLKAGRLGDRPATGVSLTAGKPAR